MALHEADEIVDPRTKLLETRKGNVKLTRVPAISCPSCIMVCTSQVGTVTTCPICRQEIGASVQPFTVNEFTFGSQPTVYHAQGPGPFLTR